MGVMKVLEVEMKKEGREKSN